MKSFKIIFLIAFLACGEEDKDSNDGMGCMTGIRKSGGTTRELIICCTRKQALAGDNVSAGGIERAKYYKSFQWTPVDDCSECQ